MSLEFVITRLCRDCVDGSCVDVCPVDCILQYEGDDASIPNQLFIEPELCIGCGACVPECPWEAIYDGDDVPAIFVEDIALNRMTVEHPDLFTPARDVVPIKHTAPSRAEVDANMAKWTNLAKTLAAGE